MKVFRKLFFLALCLLGFATHAEELTYMVKPGDTLSKIALTYRTSVDTLVGTNAIADRDLIHPKQKLNIVLPERKVAVSSHRAIATERVVVVHTSPQSEVTIRPHGVSSSDDVVLVETSLYTCTIRPSGSPHCEAKTVLGQIEQVISTTTRAATTIKDPLPLRVEREVETENFSDLANIDLESSVTFSVVKDLFPFSLNDARTKRRASIRKFLRTYLGPPHDLARMEDVLLDAPFPSPSLKPTRGEFKD